jgi:soluble lytic murein transglycosylase-like protein
MKKYCSLVSIWAIGLISFLFFSSARLTEADPTDDFSFSLGSSPSGEVYRLMSEDEVSEILEDRLDLFPKSQVPRLARHIIFLCQKYRLNPAFVLSLIEVESSYRIKAVSPVGAIGLMQVMVPTADYVIHTHGVRFSGYENFKGNSIRKGKITVAKLMDPFVNTALGISYLAMLRDHYKGSSSYVLAAYNVGPGRLDELLAQKSFRPVETKKYFLAIRNKVPRFRSYKQIKATTLSVTQKSKKRIQVVRVARVAKKIEI